MEIENCAGPSLAATLSAVCSTPVTDNNLQMRSPATVYRLPSAATLQDGSGQLRKPESKYGTQISIFNNLNLRFEHAVDLGLRAEGY